MICCRCHGFVRGHSHMHMYIHIFPRACTYNSFLFYACTICSLRVHLAQVLCPSHRATFATLIYKRIQITRQTNLFSSSSSSSSTNSSSSSSSSSNNSFSVFRPRVCGSLKPKLRRTHSEHAPNCMLRTAGHRIRDHARSSCNAQWKPTTGPAA